MIFSQNYNFTAILISNNLLLKKLLHFWFLINKNFISVVQQGACFWDCAIKNVKLCSTKTMMKYPVMFIEQK